MGVILHSLSRNDDGICFDLTVSFDDQSAQEYRASYNGKSATIEEALFMRLSVEADREFADCTLYHEELLRILIHLYEGGVAPSFPLQFGTTSFSARHPGPIRLAWRRLKRAFQRPTGRCRQQPPAVGS